MSFVVSSNRLVDSRTDQKIEFGQKITEEELLEMGVNIDALVAGGHLTPDVTSNAKKSTPPEGA
jgi:hypothetical protein